MFQISPDEWEKLKYQIGTSGSGIEVVAVGLMHSLNAVDHGCEYSQQRTGGADEYDV